MAVTGQLYRVFCSAGFAVIRHVASCLLRCMKGSSLAGSLPWYVVRGVARPQLCLLPSDPSGGFVCRIQHRPSLHHRHRNSFKQLEGIICKAWNTFHTSTYNSKSCPAVVFGGKKASLSSIHCRVQLSILRLSPYPSGLGAPALEISPRTLNQQQAPDVSQHTLKTHIKLDCLERQTQKKKKKKQ